MADDNLQKPNLSDFKEKTENFIDNLFYDKAALLLRQMEKATISLTAEERGELDKLIARLQVFLMHLIRADEAEQFFGKNLISYLTLDADQKNFPVIERARDFLTGIGDLEERAVVKKRLLNALGNNQEKIGEQPIELAGGTVVEEPTVKDWLNLYLTSVAAEEGSLGRAKFFTENPNVKKQSQNTRDVLKEIVKIQDFLKKPSTELHGFEDVMVVEDDQHNLKIFRDGRFEDVPESIKTLKPPQKRGRQTTQEPAYADEATADKPAYAEASADRQTTKMPAEEVLPASRAEAAAVDWEKLTDDLISESGIRVEAELEGRLKSAVLSGLKGIRKTTDIKEVLTREKEIGGLGLRVDEAERITRTLKQENIKTNNIKTLKQENNVETPRQGGASQNSQPEDDAARPRRAQNIKPKRTLPIAEGIKRENVHIFSEEELEHEIMPPVPMEIKFVSPPVKDKVSRPVFEEKKQNRIIPPPPSAFADSRRLKPMASDEAMADKPKMKEVENKLASLKIKPNSVESITGKPHSSDVPPPPIRPGQMINAVAGKVTDIKRVTQLVGPIDELKRFTIVDFRRLDKDPQKAMARIIDKINLLEEESFAKKIQAIKAFQQSQLYRAYLQMGQDSISQGLKIEELIDKNQKAGASVLSKDEFFAIMEVGEQLRF